ncbi:MAG: sensor histidine kinase [Acidimicrobiales bacterium]
MRTRLGSWILGMASIVAVVLILLPFRAHTAEATITLIFIVPVIISVVRGGLLIGLINTVIGALLLDFFFIQPYGTLTVGSTQNWVGLGVYLVVVTLVARVVANLDEANDEARRSADNMRRIYELSERLVKGQTVDELLLAIVNAVQRVFEFDGVSLFVLEEGELEMAASAGTALTEGERLQFNPRHGGSTSVSTAIGTDLGLRTVALTSSGRPIGLLVLKGSQISDADSSVLITFANDAALALERAHLHEQARRAAFLEEVDHLRQALLGAVSHDLRTPLATIKVASSTLVNAAQSLSAVEISELNELVEIEADRLTRLVSNLLDMTRIEAGVFQVHRRDTPVSALVSEALSIMGPSMKNERISMQVARSLPDVSIDPVLMVQVVVNLLDNALRHSPDQGVITIEARLDVGRVVLSISDQGPGVVPQDREAIFNRFVKFDTGGRAGLGLTIAKTFVDAHDETIWCDEAPGGGAMFSFTMVLASPATADAR